MRAARWLERASYRASRRGDRALRRPARQRGRQAPARPSGARSASSRTSSTPMPSGPLDRDDGVPPRARHRRRDRGDVRRQRRLLAVARAARLRGAASWWPTPAWCSSSTAAARPGRRSSATPSDLPNVRFAPLPAQGSPGRGPGHRRRARRAAEAGPGARRACRRRPTRSWPPAARSWPASTPAPRWRASSSGPGAVPRSARRPAGLPGRAQALLASPDRGRALGERGRAFVERWVSPGGRRRGLRGVVRGASRRGDASVGDPPGSLDPSWVRHHRRRRSPGSRSRARAARSAPVRVRCSTSRSPSWPSWAWRW